MARARTARRERLRPERSDEVALELAPATAYLFGQPARAERRAQRMGASAVTEIDETTRTELEAAAFRRLLEHLRSRPDVQNIDLMNLAGFCRNCLSNWYEEAAEARGLPVGREAAREMVYGMPYDEWKARHQGTASPEQQAAFAARGTGGH